MENRQYRTLRSLERIVLFLERHPIQEPPPLLLRMRTALEQCATRLRALDEEQRDHSPRQSATDVRKMRNRLRRELLMPLVRIARPQLHFTSGSEQILRVPHARASTLTVATQARRMAKFLAPHARMLTSAGYEKTFLKDLTREADALAEAATLTEKARAGRSRATLAIKREFEKAMRYVMAIEGLLMRRDTNFLRSTEWRSVRRVSARIGRPKQRARRTQVPATTEV